jgi:hypothetical protein
MMKLILVTMKLIILIILEVHASDLALPRSISSALTLLPTNLHPFHLDTEDVTYIHRCILSTIKKCEVEKFLEWCIATNLVSCLFDDPMHPKDYPMSLLLHPPPLNCPPLRLFLHLHRRHD